MQICGSGATDVYPQDVLANPALPFVADGCTPLMLASWRIGSSDLNTDENATNLIMDLIYQGANIHAQTDCTGETALHLAARYSRADAAQLLLNAGANANARDKIGRTPLHAAVAADAQGVFQVRPPEPSDIMLRRPSASFFWEWRNWPQIPQTKRCFLQIKRLLFTCAEWIVFGKSFRNLPTLLPYLCCSSDPSA